MTLILDTKTTVADALAHVDEHLDLTNVRRKLADPSEGKGYGRDRLDLMEAEYRKFLALHVAYPDIDIVPCQLVDEMWHQHILDTAAYRVDCQVIFGRFLDHFPYFGMRDAEDAKALVDAYAETLDRYREAFGEPPEETWIAADASDTSAHCRRTACKPMKCR